MSLEEEAKKRKVSTIQKYISVFGSDDGQEVLKDLMENSYLMQPTASNNEYLACRNEGKRELMLHILSNLAYDVTAILNLMNDTKNENREKKAYEKEEDFDFFRD